MHLKKLIFLLFKCKSCNLLNKYELSSNIIFNELNKETNKDTINILWMEEEF